MAKKSKKSKMTETKNKEVASAPPISPGLINISMIPGDLATLANLMSVCAKIFEEQALLAAQQNDEQRFTILNARHRLSSQFANKFVEFYKMGEPESRDMH